jgi:hypothetical protein
MKPANSPTPTMTPLQLPSVYSPFLDKTRRTSVLSSNSDADNGANKLINWFRGSKTAPKNLVSANSQLNGLGSQQDTRVVDMGTPTEIKPKCGFMTAMCAGISLIFAAYGIALLVAYLTAHKNATPAPSLNSTNVK